MKNSNSLLVPIGKRDLFGRHICSESGNKHKFNSLKTSQTGYNDSARNTAITEVYFCHPPLTTLPVIIIRGWRVTRESNPHKADIHGNYNKRIVPKVVYENIK